MGLKLLAELGLDGTGFIRGMEHAEARARGAMDAIKNFVMGAVGIYTVERAISKTVETAKNLVNESKRLSLAPDQLQVLRKAAHEGGTEIEKLAGNFEKLDIARAKALTPGTAGRDARRAFATFGIGHDQLNSMSSAQLFMGPLAASMRNRNTQGIEGELKEILGKGFGEIIPVLKTDFVELKTSMEKYGELMDTETAVKLANLNTLFDGLANMITSVLGPALVKMAEWILDIVSHSKVVEGIDFLIRQKVGESALGSTKIDGREYSATDRAEQAANALHDNMMVEYRKAGKSVADYIRDRNAPEVITGGGFFGGMVRTPFGGLGDDISKSWTEELQYLNSLVQPVADVSKKAADAAGGDMKGLQAKIEEWQKKMAEMANGLNNPKPPVGGFGAGAHLDMKALAVPSDSLTRIGNFLGGSQQALARLAQQRTEFLRQIAKNTQRGANGSHGFMVPNMGGNSVHVPEV